MSVLDNNFRNWVTRKFQPIKAGNLNGLTISNGTDATNDINIATGYATDSTGVVNITLATAMGKQLDVAWAAGGTTGSPAGGRMSAAAIANTTYHFYVIMKQDGTVDSGFDTSATAPTLPTGYVYFRRVGSILRESAAIVAFTQNNREFRRSVVLSDVNTSAPGTSAVSATLSVPLGIIVDALFSAALIDSTPASATSMLITALTQTDSAPTGLLKDLRVVASGATVPNAATGDFQRPTNTSAQIRYRLEASTADHIVHLTTLGWVDYAGLLA